MQEKLLQWVLQRTCLANTQRKQNQVNCSDLKIQHGLGITALTKHISPILTIEWPYHSSVFVMINRVVHSCARRTAWLRTGTQKAWETAMGGAVWAQYKAGRGGFSTEQVLGQSHQLEQGHNYEWYNIVVRINNLW